MWCFVHTPHIGDESELNQLSSHLILHLLIITHVYARRRNRQFHRTLRSEITRVQGRSYYRAWGGSSPPSFLKFLMKWLDLAAKIF